MKKMDSSEQPYYSIGEVCKIETKSYEEVVSVHREKRKNINGENVSALMLSCLPGVSVKSAQALLNKYGSLKNLIHAVENKDDELKNITMESSGGKIRKLGKNVLESLEKII